MATNLSQNGYGVLGLLGCWVVFSCVVYCCLFCLLLSVGCSLVFLGCWLLAVFVCCLLLALNLFVCVLCVLCVLCVFLLFVFVVIVVTVVFVSDTS